jgi:hypothetical protein
MNANHDDITRRLIAAMREEVQHAMTVTNTPEELRKFRHTIEQGRKRHRTYAVATAAAVMVVAGTAIAVKESGNVPHSGQITAPLESQTATASAQPSDTASPASLPLSTPVASPRALAAGIPIAKVTGPGVFGGLALGSVWAVQEHGDATGDTGHVYRLDPTGQRILSTTAYAGSDPDDLPPFEAGQAVLVPSTAAGGASRYIAFNAKGRQIGTLPVAKVGLGAGDATGGWVVSDTDAISKIDASGTKVVKTVVLPGTKVAGIAVGGGSVWVADQVQNRLLRFDPTSGTITGATAVGPVDEFLPIAYSNGAVFVPNQNYELRRIDATTMKTTAIVSSPPGASWFVISIGANGDVWAQPAQGVVDDLDPATLATKRAVQLQPTVRDGGTFGVVATSSRVYMADGDDGYVLSFPLS